MKPHAAALPILSLLLFALPAQETRDLSLREVFTLTYFMVSPHEEPLGWIDAEHYLAFDAGAPGREGDKTFWKVNARTGDRSPYLDRATFAAALSAQPGFTAERVDEVLSDAENFEWDGDHGAFLLNTANDLFYYALAEGRVRRLTNTPGDEVGEQFSPDGKMVAFVHDYDLHVVAVDGSGAPRPLTDGGNEDLFFGRLDWVYQEELYGRGNFQGFWWSPDSSRIALLKLDESPVEEFVLVSDEPWRPEVEVTNYPKTGEPNPIVDLGVVPVAGGEITWFDASRYGTQDMLVVRVTWHPGSGEVFFQMQEREQTWLDMLAGDVETGATRLVFHEESDCWIEAGPEPVWEKDGATFLWQSERSGFRHVYRYDREGELLGRLTEGEWEVEEIAAVDETGGWIYYLSDQADVKEEQLWRMRADGGGKERVTETPGVHDVSLAPDHGLLITTVSSLAKPMAIRVLEAAGDPVRTVFEARTQLLRPFRLQEPEFFQVETRDGFVMEAMMIKPRGYREGQRYPVLQHTYSGPHAPKVVNRWAGRDWLWHQMMAQQGYLVWICDNRSASGKGRQAAAACWRDMGTSELRDLEDSVDWLVQRGYADPQRVMIWGWSYGAYQTLFNLTHSEKWKAGIAVNPVTDWRLYDTIYTERYMGLPQTNPEGYARSSVLEAAGALHGELLLVHSAMDDNVHMQNSLQLLHALQMAQKQVRFMAYPRVRHGMENINQQLHLFTMMTRFVAENL